MGGGRLRGRRAGLRDALCFGGPYLGLFACSDAQVRRLPGRIVGETVDSSDRRAFVTTLRAREQDIRREKATSNVCTNQTLMAVTSAIQMGWLGTQGCARSRRAALRARTTLRPTCRSRRRSAARRLSRSFESSRCVSPRPATVVIERMAEHGCWRVCSRRTVRGARPSIEGANEDVLLVTVTERRTKEEIDRYVGALKEVARVSIAPGGRAASAPLHGPRNRTHSVRDVGRRGVRPTSCARPACRHSPWMRSCPPRI